MNLPFASDPAPCLLWNQTFMGQVAMPEIRCPLALVLPQGLALPYTLGSSLRLFHPSVRVSGLYYVAQ